MSLRMSGRQAAMAASQAAATASAESLAPGDVSLAALQQPSGHAHLHRVYNTTHGRVTSHIYFSKMDMHRAAQMPMRPVPVRLDLEVDGIKIKDAFTWNLNEAFMSPEEFARLLVDDLFDYQPSNYHMLIQQVALAIRKQLDAWKSAVHNNEDAILENNGDMVSVAPTAADTVDSEWRTVVKLDLQIGNKHLTDQFEWPLIAATSPAGNQLPMPNPESYARQLCAELGIGGEFVVDVAHSIREQICYARMNFEEVSKMYNIPVPPLRVGDHAEDWGPAMEELSDGEIESRQKELERTARRMRRSTRVTTNAIVINRMSTTMPVGGGGSRDDDSDESEYSDSDSEDDQRRRTAARPVVQERVKRRRTYRPPCYAIGSFRAGNVDLLTLSQQQQQQPVQQPVQMAVTATPGVPSAQLRQQMEQQEKQRQLLLAEQVRMMSQSETLGSYNIPLPPPSNGVYQSPTIPSRTERVPYRTFKPRPTTDEERQILEKLEKTANISKLPESMSPPKNHRGFGASANKFNEDGSVEVGEFRSKWRCTWCLLSGKFTPTLRRGPMGSKTLCNACGIWYSKHGSLPKERYHEHEND